MNRKVRLHTDVIHPTAKHSHPPKNNKVMEKQFNHSHRAVKLIYIPGKSVLAKDYRNGKEKWIQGCILLRSGNVTYDVVNTLGSTCKSIKMLSSSRDQIKLHLTLPPENRGCRETRTI